MKKRRIFLVVAILILLAAVLWYVESRWQQDEEIPLWSMVPESAALVYETTELPANWETFHSSQLWKNLQTIESFHQMEQQMLWMDSLVNVQQFFTGKQLLISTHIISKDAFDFTYFFKINSNKEHNSLVQAIKRLEQEDHIQSDSRMFNGFRISELTDKRDGRQFSYLLHHNVFAGSFTPFLIEDVVRNIETEFREYSFQQYNPSMESASKLAGDEGNLYLNMSKLPLLLSVFTTNDVLPYLQPLAYLSSTIFLDVNLTDEQLLLNGFSKTGSDRATHTIQPSSEASVWLSAFETEQPQAIDLYDYVPERTAVLYHFGARHGDALHGDARHGDAVGGNARQGKSWLFNLYQQQEGKDEKLIRQIERYRKNLNELYNTQLNNLVSWFEGEMGLMVLESIDTEAPDKILMMEASDTAQARTTLQQLEDKLRQDAEGESYTERFAGYQIGEISFKEFPAAMVGPVALGFDQCFYLLSDRYVIFANSIRALKRLIADREAENTWDKSIREVRFLETTLNESNVSVFVNTSRTWRLFQAHLSPKWKDFSNTHADILKSFDHLAIQFSKSEDDFYTSVAVSYQPLSLSGRGSEQFSDVSRLFVDNPIQTRPFVVRDHTDQTLEVLFQDETHQLYLAALDGEIQWKDSLAGSIIGDVYQIDFFNNGKLQYLFATDSAIHVMDRTGAYVSGYPSYMPEGVRIRHLSLIDYDNSKSYRFLVSDHEGKLWMFNKDRENLEGWNPNMVVNSPVATAPFHVRVGNKDFIMAIQEDGSIYALNRRGQPYAGFPLDLNTPIQSMAYTELGSTPGNTVLTTVTVQGEIISFNLLGNLAKREQIYRPSSDTRFQLCIDALGKTFVIVRQDEQLFGVLDRNGQLLFEKNYMSPAALASGMLEVQYYDFGAGNEIFAVTDEVQEFTYLFTAQGRLIKDRPIESRFPVGVLFFDNENRFQVFRNFENEFSILSFTK